MKRLHAIVVNWKLKRTAGKQINWNGCWNLGRIRIVDWPAWDIPSFSQHSAMEFLSEHFLPTKLYLSTLQSRASAVKRLMPNETVEAQSKPYKYGESQFSMYVRNNRQRLKGAGALDERVWQLLFVFNVSLPRHC